jgi:hypothetical protein
VKLFLGDFNILCIKNDNFVLHKEYSNILNVCSLKDNPMSIEVEISEHLIAFCTGKTTKEHAGVVYRVRIDQLPPMLNHYSLLNCAVSRD